MRRFAITLLALATVAAFSTDFASAADRFGWNSHHNTHHQLQYNRQARSQAHHDAHHYPMSRYQHQGLHQNLRHDAYHDRVNHNTSHNQSRFNYGYRSGLGSYNRGFSYQTPGFSFSYHR